MEPMVFVNISELYQSMPNIIITQIIYFLDHKKKSDLLYSYVLNQMIALILQMLICVSITMWKIPIFIHFVECIIKCMNENANSRRASMQKPKQKHTFIDIIIHTM